MSLVISFFVSRTCISKCSGALLFDISAASSKSFTTTIFPFFSAASATSFVDKTSNCFLRALLTFRAISFEVVNRSHLAVGSCSACANRSAAINSGFPVSSAMISTSLGPAIKSIQTVPYTSFLAAATNLFPGPTMA
jgi:hypothetical protein